MYIKDMKVFFSRVKYQHIQIMFLISFLNWKIIQWNQLVAPWTSPRLISLSLYPAHVSRFSVVNTPTGWGAGGLGSFMTWWTQDMMTSGSRMFPTKSRSIHYFVSILLPLLWRSRMDKTPLACKDVRSKSCFIHVLNLTVLFTCIMLYNIAINYIVILKFKDTCILYTGTGILCIWIINFWHIIDTTTSIWKN